MKDVKNIIDLTIESARDAVAENVYFLLNSAEPKRVALERVAIDSPLVKDLADRAIRIASERTFEAAQPEDDPCTVQNRFVRELVAAINRLLRSDPTNERVFAVGEATRETWWDVNCYAS